MVVQISFSAYICISLLTVVKVKRNLTNALWMDGLNRSLLNELMRSKVYTPACGLYTYTLYKEFKVGNVN